jgi:hypothetical protein
MGWVRYLIERVGPPAHAKGVFGLSVAQVRCKLHRLQHHPPVLLVVLPQRKDEVINRRNAGMMKEEKSCVYRGSNAASLQALPAVLLVLLVQAGCGP